MESWYTEYCPKCNSKNWINNGDESDITGIDIDTIKCWKCSSVSLITPEGLEIIDYKDIE